MSYEELIPILNNRHLYPGKTVTMTSKGDVVSGLYLYCPPILSETKLKKLREALPEGFIATWFPNLSELHITLKK